MNTPTASPGSDGGSPAGPDRLALRGRALRAVRAWFEQQGFLEVETPVRIPVPALELHIDAIPADGAYLRTSPELHLKRLLGRGYTRLVEIGPCFRRGERGDRHNTEFTLVEWYRTGTDYLGILDDMRALLRSVAGCVGSARVTFDGDWELIPVSEAFLRHAGWDPLRSYDADRFDVDLVTRVEPALPRDRPVVLIDYPAEAAALARHREGDPRCAERWELYAGGLELANAYTELVDAREQRRRFEECRAERRALGKPDYETDEEFLAALERGLPPCAGVALGFDRLLMVLAGEMDIGRVRAFTPGFP